MALAFDASTPPARASAAVNPATLRDEIQRLSSRLVRAREFYDQDQHSRDPEVPLDEQLAVIASYSSRLETLTEQLRLHDSGEVAAAQVPEQRAPMHAQPPAAPEQQWTQHAPPPAPPAPQPTAPPVEQRTEQPAPPPAAPTTHRPPPPGAGVANPDGTPLLGDAGSILRTEDAAVGEYVRHMADQRWLATNGRSAGADFDVMCNAILAALAHKHGVTLEDERQRLARQVDARYRRDYG